MSGVSGKWLEVPLPADFPLLSRITVDQERSDSIEISTGTIYTPSSSSSVQNGDPCFVNVQPQGVAPKHLSTRLYPTDRHVLLLAWLRILESDADRGWALVLEEAGYTLDEIQTMLDSTSYPPEMREFTDELAGLVSVGGIAQRVFSQYGYDGTHADVLLHTIQSVHRTTTMTRGDLIRFLKRGIEAGSKHDVTANAGTNSVTVQTIHAVKGLEHPIVILANMNRHKFPTSGRNDGTITYRKETGLRQRRLYAEAHGYPYLYDN